MSARTHVIARARPELARTERDHSCHVFPLPEGALPGEESPPGLLQAYCGYSISPGRAEMLDTPNGLPCTTCLLSSMIQT